MKKTNKQAAPKGKTATQRKYEKPLKINTTFAKALKILVTEKPKK